MKRFGSPTAFEEGPMKSKFLMPVVLAMILPACEIQPPLQSDVPLGAEGTDVAMSLGIPTETRSDVIRFSDMAVVEDARAGLHRQADGIRVRTHTAELSHGDVVTLWWVIFNNPEECAGPCGEADLFDGPEGPTGVEPSCLFADGSIVGGNGGARFHDRLGIGEARDSCIDFFVEAVDGLEGQDHGLTNPTGAEIHLVMRSHGPLIPGMVSEQRSTFGGGCKEFLGPGVDELQTGQCSDQQFAVFPAPDTGG
jgi:hypothetical protein